MHDAKNRITTIEKELRMEQNQISPLKKVNGAKFVVVFIVVSAVVAVTFCYAIYNSYQTRPKIKIEEEK